jgi:predicted ATPase
MIRKLVIRRFKRFYEETFEFPGHVVLAGPNNTGKTTVLQAIAAWELALNRWRELNDFQKYDGEYVKAPLARHDFVAVPLRKFDLLWNERKYRQEEPIEIEMQWGRLWKITMELIPDTTEQIYVRPKADADPKKLRAAKLQTVYVPAMTGLAIGEPIYQPAFHRLILGQGKPGDIIRNLLLEAHLVSGKWNELESAIKRFFGIEILPPNAKSAYILAQYRSHPQSAKLDITNAGSGFMQVLMLLTFLHTRPASVLLLDEPDAHLHLILQDAIYSELRSVAARQRSQLIIATHSEVFINSVEPRELCHLFIQPKLVKTTQERAKLVKSLGIITNTDIMLAESAPGVFFVEGHTDIAILREWARILGHPAYETLNHLFWKPTVSDRRLGAPGISAKDYYDALTMICDDLPGLELIDGDGNPRLPKRPMTGRGLQRLQWQRYEIESYLVHPAALERFVKKEADGNLDALRQYFEDNYPPPFIRDPLHDYPFLIGTKARTQLIPPALHEAGLSGIPYTRYHEIAAVMLPEEIHPEVIEKLDAIQKAFRL